VYPGLSIMRKRCKYMLVGPSMVCTNLRFLFWGLLRASDRISRCSRMTSHEQSRSCDGTTALITSLSVIPYFVVGFILTASLSNANRLSCYLEFLS
jgi:hypothetical protein